MLKVHLNFAKFWHIFVDRSLEFSYKSTLHSLPMKMTFLILGTNSTRIHQKQVPTILLACKRLPSLDDYIWQYLARLVRFIVHKLAIVTALNYIIYFYCIKKILACWFRSLNIYTLNCLSTKICDSLAVPQQAVQCLIFLSS